MNYISPTFVLGINFLREFASDKTTSILGSTSVVFALTSVIFRMVHFWNSFLGNTIYEEEDCFKWTYCKDCGIYRWVRVCTADVGGQGHRKSGQFCLVLVRPDRQTTDSGFSKNPDRIRTADRIETDRIRTDRHLTENPDRIQTADSHRIMLL